MNDIKTSQKVIENTIDQDHDRGAQPDQDDRDSVEKVPQPEMTQSPKRPKGNKNAKIQNPPQGVLK